MPNRRSLCRDHADGLHGFCARNLAWAGDAERVAVREVIDSGWLTTGSRTVAFEEQFAAAVGGRHAVAVNSAAVARPALIGERRRRIGLP